LNIQLYHKLIENPTLLTTDSLKDLEDLVKNFPLVENFRILYALNLLILDDYRYDSAITKAAIYSSDRRKLKEWVNRIEEYLDAEKNNDDSEASDLSHQEEIPTESDQIISEEEHEDVPFEEIAIRTKEDEEVLKEEQEKEQAEQEVIEIDIRSEEEKEVRDLETDKKNIHQKRTIAIGKKKASGNRS